MVFERRKYIDLDHPLEVTKNYNETAASIHHLAAPTVRGMPSARDDTDLAKIVEAMFAISVWSIVFWILELVLLVQATPFPLSCVGNDVTGNIAMWGVIKYNITPMVRVMHWLYTVLTILLLIMIVRYYRRLHVLECKIKQSQGFEPGHFSNALWFGVVFECLICAIQPVPLGDMVFEGAWANRQTVMGVIMFVRLYHGIRLMRDRSTVYRRRHMIISCSSRVLPPADFDWWYAFKILVERRPVSVCVVAGLGGILVFSVSFFAAEWPSLEQVFCVDGILKTFSFGDAIYVTVVTMSSTGYGDVAPKTSWGRFIAVIAIIAGMFVMALIIAVTTRKLEMQDSEKASLEWVRMQFLERKLRHTAAVVIARFWMLTKGRCTSASVRKSCVQMHSIERDLLTSKSVYHGLQPASLSSEASGVEAIEHLLARSVAQVNHRIDKMEENQREILSLLRTA